MDAVLTRQSVTDKTIFSGVTATPASPFVQFLSGQNGSVDVWINKTGTGSASLLIERSRDAVNWVSCGYQESDVAAPTRAVGAFAVAGGTQNYVLQILDRGDSYRFTLTISGSATVSVYVNSVPVG